MQYVVSLLFASLCYFLIIQLTLLIFFLCLFSCFVCLSSIFCILCFCTVLCIVSTFVYNCLFPIFVQVYRRLPPGGNPAAVNICHIISYYILSPCTTSHCIINLLNPTGHVMHHKFNIQQLYVLPTLYLCVLYLPENKQRLVPLTA